MHEHGAICRALRLFGSYDQVALGNLAGIEALVKRLQLIEEAHVANPSAPSYEAAEHLMGTGRRMGAADFVVNFDSQVRDGFFNSL